MVESPYSSLGKRKILLAEDVELNQYLARHMMEAWGFEVDVAENGRIALLLVEQNSYDLVLMDIQMPEMDGMEATRQIRLLKDTVKAGIPIIALTANALKGDRERFLAAGMDDYLSKPFTEPNLFQIIADNLTNVTTKYYPPVFEMPEPVTQPTNKLYDLTMVNSIAGGDDGFVKRMLQLFLDTIPPSLLDLQRETAAQNWEQVGKLAHKMKSTIDSMGIVSLKETIRYIENNGKKGTGTELIPDNVKLVEAVMQQCMDQVRNDFFA